MKKYDLVIVGAGSGNMLPSIEIEGWSIAIVESEANADPETRLLLGAHIMRPQAATLIQPLIQAMSLGNTIDQLAHEVLYIHPALTEVIENVLLDLT